jgi:hypothetical protein
MKEAFRLASARLTSNNSELNPTEDRVGFEAGHVNVPLATALIQRKLAGNPSYGRIARSYSELVLTELVLLSTCSEYMRQRRS